MLLYVNRLRGIHSYALLTSELFGHFFLEADFEETGNRRRSIIRRHLRTSLESARR